MCDALKWKELNTQNRNRALVLAWTLFLALVVLHTWIRQNRLREKIALRHHQLLQSLMAGTGSTLSHSEAESRSCNDGTRNYRA